jgi:hypothetical protein
MSEARSGAVLEWSRISLRSSGLRIQLRARLFILAARCVRVLSASLPKRGSRECRVHAAPAVSCAKRTEETAQSIQVQRRHSGIPCAMALRLMPRSPRRRIRLVTVAASLMADRPGWIDVATGRLAPATGVGTTRFCRTLQRRSSCTHLVHSRLDRPANTLRGDAVASTTSHPAFRDDHDTPLAWGETRRFKPLICPTAKAEFCPSGCFAAATAPQDGQRRACAVPKPDDKAFIGGMVRCLAGR